MNALLDQLGLDNTFFVELGIFAVLFFILAKVYFKPFLKLFELRHQKTVADREAAERMLADATAKLEEYRKILSEEKLGAKKQYDAVIAEAKQSGSALLAQARTEARKITQEAADQLTHQQGQLKKELDAHVDLIAKSVVDKLLSGKV